MMLTVRNASGVIQTMKLFCLFIVCLCIMFGKMCNIMNNTSLGRNKMSEYKNTILGNADTICLHWVMKYLKKDQEAQGLCENVIS